MGESEGRIVTYSYSPEPKSDSEHQENLRDIARQQALDELQVRAYGRSVSAKPKKDPAVAERRAFILSLDSLPEQDYCKQMHDAGHHTPLTWQAWGCPPDYLDALNLKKRKLRNRFLTAVRHSERKNARRRSQKK
jgi:hypothetical protein